MMIVSIGLAIMVPTNPAFVPIAILLTILGVVVAVPISNTYEEIMSASLLTGAQAAFPISTILLANLPIFIAVFGVLFIIVTFAKLRMQGGAV
jgi:hypothetical protein